MHRIRLIALASIFAFAYFIGYLTPVESISAEEFDEDIQILDELDDEDNMDDAIETVEIETETIFNQEGNELLVEAYIDAEDVSGDWLVEVGGLEAEVNDQDGESVNLSFDRSDLKATDGFIPLKVTFNGKVENRPTEGEIEKNLVFITVQSSIKQQNQLDLKASLKDVENAEGDWIIAIGEDTIEKKDQQEEITLGLTLSEEKPEEKHLRVSFIGQVDETEVEGEYQGIVIPSTEKEKETAPLNECKDGLSGLVNVSHRMPNTNDDCQPKGNTVNHQNKDDHKQPKETNTEETNKQESRESSNPSQTAPKTLHEAEKSNKDQPIQEEKPQPKAEISLSSTILDHTRVEITASLEHAHSPKGTWKISMNQQTPQVFEDEDGTVTAQFQTGDLSDPKVPVSAEFIGNDQNGNPISVKKAQTIQVKETVTEEEIEEDVEEVNDGYVITQVSADLNGQVGGKLPQTATSYPIGILAGCLLLIGGGLLFGIKRKKSV